MWQIRAYSSLAKLGNPTTLRNLSLYRQNQNHSLRNDVTCTQSALLIPRIISHDGCVSCSSSIDTITTQWPPKNISIYPRYERYVFLSFYWWYLRRWTTWNANLCFINFAVLAWLAWLISSRILSFERNWIEYWFYYHYTMLPNYNKINKHEIFSNQRNNLSLI